MGGVLGIVFRDPGQIEDGEKEVILVRRSFVRITMESPVRHRRRRDEQHPSRRERYQLYQPLHPAHFISLTKPNP